MSIDKALRPLGSLVDDLRLDATDLLHLLGDCIFGSHQFCVQVSQGVTIKHIILYLVGRYIRPGRLIDLIALLRINQLGRLVSPLLSEPVSAQGCCCLVQLCLWFQSFATTVCRGFLLLVEDQGLLAFIFIVFDAREVVSNVRFELTNQK